MHNKKRENTSPSLVHSLYLKYTKNKFLEVYNYYQYHQHWFPNGKWRSPEQEKFQDWTFVDYYKAH